MVVAKITARSASEGIVECHPNHPRSHVGLLFDSLLKLEGHQIFCVVALLAVLIIALSQESFAESLPSASANDGTYATVTKIEIVDGDSHEPIFTKKNYPWHIQPKQPIWQAATSYAPHPLLFALLLMMLTLWVTVWDGLEKGNIDKSVPELSK